MKRAALFLLVCLAGGSSLPFLDGVDLMAMKKQEEERRKRVAKSKVAVNDGNVGSVVAGGKSYGFSQMESDATAAEEAGAAPDGQPPPVSDQPVPEESKPEFWKSKQQELLQRIDTLRGEIEREQSELNRLWSEFYNKNIAAEQEAIRVQISQLTNQIEQKKVFVSEAQGQLADLLEKARKAGVPPGWLR